MKNKLFRLTFLAMWSVVLLMGSHSLLSGQATINGIFPASTGNNYYAGQSISIYGSAIYTNGGCNQITMLGPGGSLVYSGLAGTDGLIDSMRFDLPTDIPCGSYTLQVESGISCPASFDNITIFLRDTINMSYPLGDTVLCVGESGNIATLTQPSKTAGLNFFTVPSVPGLILNDTNGLIGVHSGSVGQHQIIVVTDTASCGDTDTFDLEIKPVTASSLNYPAGPFCPAQDTMIQPLVPKRGTFSASPGLAWFDQDSGYADLRAAAAGNYIITYVPPQDACQSSSSFNITVDPLDVAVFDYDSAYCVGNGFAIPTITSLPPGQFQLFIFGSPGVNFNTSSGALDLSTVNSSAALIRFQPSSTCSAPSQDIVDFSDPPDASFMYPSDTLCGTDSVLPILTDPSVHVAFIDTGGVFGNFNTGTGAITPSLSNQGGPFWIAHSATNSLCSDTVGSFLWISNVSSTSISYNGTVFCQKDSVSPIVASGALTGEYRAYTPLGVPALQTALDPVTGTIRLYQAPAGTYDIYYVQNLGNCFDSVQVGTTITIDSLVQANFQFRDSICVNSPAEFITTLTDLANPPGLTFNYTLYVNGVDAGVISNDSLLDPSSLPAGGQYPIVLTVTNNSCTDTMVDYLRVIPVLDPSFQYLNTEYCASADVAFPRPYISGDPGGYFYEPTGNVVFSDNLSGEIDLGLSGTGSFNIIYEVGSGVCPVRDTFSLDILASNEAEFTYGATEFCSYVDTIRPDTGFTTGGIFAGVSLDSVNPGNIIIDPDSGWIDLMNSDSGTYQISYTLGSGTCDLNFQLLLRIIAADDSVTIDYPDQSLCPNDPNPVPTVVGNIGTGFFPGTNGISFASPAGEVNLSASLPGAYQIDFTTTGECPIRVSDSLFIDSLIDPFFTYNPKFYCTTEPNPTPAVLLNAGGTFSIEDNDQIIQPYINPSTGEIYLDSIQSNTQSPFIVSYTPNSGCTETAQDVLVISLGPDSTTFTVLPGDTICQDQEAEFTAQGGDVYTFYLNGVEIPDTSSELDGAFRYITSNLTDNDTVSVTIQNSSACRDSQAIIMTVITNPVMSFVQTPRTISSGQNSTLLVSSTVDQTFFDWQAYAIGGVQFSPSSGLEGPTPLGQPENITSLVTLDDEASPAQIFFSVVPWIDVSGNLQCFGDSLVDTVLVNPENEAIFIPEVITPDANGYNDTWQIQWREDIDETHYTILLFNRSGGQVAYMSPLNAMWDGEDNPDGVYWWKLINNLTGQTERTGGLTIRRK